ncbi:MAG: hypothetical protein ACRDQ4_01130 [Pseudonocardiaceae bacterium]
MLPHPSASSLKYVSQLKQLLPFLVRHRLAGPGPWPDRDLLAPGAQRTDAAGLDSGRSAIRGGTTVARAPTQGRGACVGALATYRRYRTSKRYTKREGDLVAVSPQGISRRAAHTVRWNGLPTVLTSALSTALARSGFWPVQDRGRVLTDLAVAIADGATTISEDDQ